MPRESIYKRYNPSVAPERVDGKHCYWFVFSSNKLLTIARGDKLGIPYLKSLAEININPVRTQYLGKLQGHPCYSAEAAAETPAPQGMVFRDLRSVYGAVDEDTFLLAGRAIQIVAWDQTNQYCGRCGLKTETLPDERAKKCPACGLISYPRIAPAVIIAVIKEKKLLLTHYANLRGKWHSLIAGFVEPGETLEECIQREVLEEVGLRVKNIKYFGSQPWPFPNSLMIGFTAEYESGEIVADGKEISEAGWYAAANLPEIPPKISIARELIDRFVENNSTATNSADPNR
jgi:NAD+ diphosphatase